MSSVSTSEGLQIAKTERRRSNDLILQFERGDANSSLAQIGLYRFGIESTLDETAEGLAEEEGEEPALEGLRERREGK